MAETLFVLGNGFDLAHGLPTTYRDFFYFVEAIKCHFDSPPPLENIPNLKENLRSDVLDYLSAVFASKDIPDYIDAIKSALNLETPNQINLWHSYFHKKIHDGHGLTTWIDFEKEIYLFFSDNSENFSSKKISHSVFSSIINFDMNLLFFARYPEKTEELRRKMRGNSTVPLREEYLKESILFLYQELQRYTFCLELYLRFFVTDICLKNSKPNSTMKTMFNPKPDKSAKSAKSAKPFILSFNYTDTYIHKGYRSDARSQHIHGAVRNQATLEQAIKSQDFLSSPLVLGFHYEETPSKTTSSDVQFLWFEKFFQRMLHKTGNDVFSWLKEQSAGTINTVVYGHSLDKTDADLIQIIFDKSESVTVYHLETSLPQLISNLVTIFGRDVVNEYYQEGKLVFTQIPDK